MRRANLIRLPQWNTPMLWVALLVSGLAIEGLVWQVASFWATRFTPESATLGPVVLLLSASLVCLAGQLLHALFAIPTVAAMSLSLLAAMVGWLALLLLPLALLLMICLALCSLVGVPVRLAADQVRRIRASRS